MENPDQDQFPIFDDWEDAAEHYGGLCWCGKIHEMDEKR